MKKAIYLWITLALCLSYQCVAQVSSVRGVPARGFTAEEAEFIKYLNGAGAPGGSIAISKNGKLIYARSFGHADMARMDRVTPNHLFRWASVSKSINSIGLMKLVERGQVRLTDKVFGPSGILNDAYYYQGITVTDQRWYDITVQHLLEHTTGMGSTNLVSRTGGFVHSTGLCAHVLEVANRLHEPHPGSDKSIIKFLLSQPLSHAPGAAHSYNNSGFTILAQVIAKVAGTDLETYMRNNIFAPLGIYDIKAGKSLYCQKQEREVEYITHYRYVSSIYNDNVSVPWQYGGWSHEAALGSGGWIGSPKDLVKLLNAVDGSSTRPDILNAATRNLMLTPTTVKSPEGHSVGYAKGWGVHDGNFHHNGGADGNSAYWGCRANGICFAAVVNGNDAASSRIEAAVNKIIDMVATNTSTTADFFLTPTVNASNIRLSNVTSNAATLTWTNGNGNKRMVIMSADDPVYGLPDEGHVYVANAQMRSGFNFGGASFLVYNGTGNSVTVTNLVPGTTYYVRIIEYNQNTSGDLPLYLLGGNPSAQIYTPSTTTALPPKWFSANIGQVGIPGAATYNYNTGTFNLSASGTGISGTADQFRYTYRTELGNSSVILRVNSLSQNANNASRVGIMYRESINAGAPYVSLNLIPGIGVFLFGRATPGTQALIDSWLANATAPIWLRLDRFNNQFVAFTSSDGDNWKVLGTLNLTMASNGLVGMATTSGTNSATISTSISNVRVKITAPCLPVTGFNLNTSSMTLTNGQTGSFTATITPSNACNKGLIWSSSNKDVAVIDAKTGLITPKSNGISTIHVSTAEGYHSKTATVTVSGMPVTYYRIKNRHTGEYLVTENNILKYRSTILGDTARWSLEYLNANEVEIKNKISSGYINIEKPSDSVHVTARTFGWWSSRWIKSENSEGYTLFNNVWKPEQMLSNEHHLGYVEHVNSSSSWWSAQWILEPAPLSTFKLDEETETSETAKTTLFPNPSSGFVFVNSKVPALVEICTLQGLEIHKEMIEPQGAMSLDKLDNGTYIYKINGTYAGKLSVLK